MKQKNLRRIVAGASAITLTAGLTAVFGMSTATADPQSITWKDGDSNYKRTVSDNNPAIGDTITMTTNFYRTGGLGESIKAVKDLRNPCLTFVSANPGDKLTQGTEKPGQDFARVEGSWRVEPIGVPKTREFTFTYKVSETCPLGVPLTSAMHYGGDLGPGTYEDKGPQITVKQAASTTTATVDPAPQSDRASTITATVTPDAATGEVEFFKGDTSLGRVPLSNHKATVDWTPTGDDAGQAYLITAKYLGDINREASESSALTGTVAPAPTAPAAPTGIAASANPATTGAEVTISGQSEAGSSVEVTAGTQTRAASAGEDGAFSCVITPDTAGDIAVTAIATNGVGPSAPSEALTLTVNPAVVIPGSPELTVSPDTVTAGDDVTITVTTDEGNEVVITAGGTPIHTATAGTDGTVTTTHTTTDSGSIDFTATAGNSAGTSAATSAAVTVEKKIVTPEAPALTVSDESVTAGDDVTVTAVTEAGNTLVIVADGVEIFNGVSTTGTETRTFNPDTAGTSTVTATAGNSAGTSAATSTTVTVEKKIVTPDAPALTVSDASVIAGDTVEVTAVTKAGNTLVIKAGNDVLFNGVSATGTETLTHATTTDGSIEFTATAGNTAGTSGAATKTVTVEKKIVTPGAPALSVSPETVVEGQDVTITVNTSAGNTVVISTGGTTIDTATADADGSVTTTYTAATPGDLTITATAGNSAGTSTASTKTVTVEKKIVTPEAPELTVSKDTVTAGDTVTVTAVTEAGNTLVIKAGDDILFNDVSTTGTETAIFPTNDAGSIGFTATASNTAGTSTPATKTVTVEEKIVTPAAPELTVSKDTVTAGDTIQVTAATEAGNALVITADGVEIFKTESGTGTVDFALITAGTVTFSATASNTAGISPATSKTVTVAALPAGEVKVSLNPASPKAGQKVEVSVTGGDDGTDFTITSGDITLCEGTVDADGIGTCEWTATEGEHTLTAKVTVNGNDAVDTHTVTVAPAESTGGGNAGGDGGTGSLGSLGNLFGSLR